MSALWSDRGIAVWQGCGWTKNHQGSICTLILPNELYGVLNNAALFLRAVVIQYYKLSGLQQPKFILTPFCKPEIPNKMSAPAAGSEAESIAHLSCSCWWMFDNSWLKDIPLQSVSILTVNSLCLKSVSHSMWVIGFMDHPKFKMISSEILNYTCKDTISK